MFLISFITISYESIPRQYNVIKFFIMNIVLLILKLYMVKIYCRFHNELIK